MPLLCLKRECVNSLEPNFPTPPSFLTSNDCLLSQSDAVEHFRTLGSAPFHLIDTYDIFSTRIQVPATRQQTMVGKRHRLTSPRNRTLRYVLLGALFLGALYWFKKDRAENRFQDIISATPKTGSSAAHAGLAGLAPPNALHQHEDMRSSSTSVGTKHEKTRKSQFLDLRKSIPWTTFDGGECLQQGRVGPSVV